MSQRRRRALATTLLLIATSGATAHATALAVLKASFSPGRLGRSTTVFFGFRFSKPMELKTMELRLPAGMTFTHSQLGLEPCQPETLEDLGPEGCPLDSRLGQGTAFTEVPYGEPPKRNIKERTKVTALLGPITREQMTALFFVDGIFPVGVERTLIGYIRRVPAPYGEALRVKVPLDEAWNEGPYVGITHFSSTIGPAGLHYTRKEHGQTIRFKPEGLDTPETCPKRGFPVAAYFTWWTGGSARAVQHVPCPPTREFHTASTCLGSRTPSAGSMTRTDVYSNHRGARTIAGGSSR